MLRVDPTPGIWTEPASQLQLTAQLDEQRESSEELFSLAVKANIGVAGFVRSAACRALAGDVELIDAPVVAALRRAGGIVVGMTNMHELAFGITSENASYGSVELPGHPGFSAGGSSGGSAAAVAEGSATLALGTDTGGSVSIPASLTGTYGLRPTTGRWPTAGTIGLSWTRDTPGVFARDIDGLDFADRAVTGERSGAGILETGALRLGVPSCFLRDLAPETAAAFDAFSARVADHATLVELDFDAVRALTDAAEMPTVLWEARRLLSAVVSERVGVGPRSSFDWLVDRVASPDVQAVLRAEQADPVTADAYATAQRATLEARAAYEALLDELQLDAIVFPTTPAPAPHLGSGGSLFHLYTRHTGQGTMLGAPMVTIPLPVGAGELPIGVTMQGRRFDDRRVLDIARIIDVTLRG